MSQPTVERGGSMDRVRTIVIEQPGATHYRVGQALLDSGLLTEDGYQPMPRTRTDCALLILSEDADPADVRTLVTNKIDELVGTGEIVLPS